MNLRSEIKRGMARGFGFGLVFLGMLGGSFLLADSLHVFSSGQTISSSQINANFEKMAPVGTILAWHKNFTGTPSLPAGWVECDGSTVSDTESVYHNQTLPDLNSDVYSGNGGRFLRGATTSGTIQGDLFQGHHHWFQGNSGAGSSGSPYYVNNWFGVTSADTSGGSVTSPRSDGTNGTPRNGIETRPANMSVVWIIRIK